MNGIAKEKAIVWNAWIGKSCPESDAEVGYQLEGEGSKTQTELKAGNQGGSVSNCIVSRGYEVDCQYIIL